MTLDISLEGGYNRVSSVTTHQERLMTITQETATQSNPVFKALDGGVYREGSVTEARQFQSDYSLVQARAIYTINIGGKAVEVSPDVWHQQLDRIRR